MSGFCLEASLLRGFPFSALAIHVRLFYYEKAMSLQTMLYEYLGRCTARALRQEHPVVIAITGTVGKSTTRNAIAAILNADDPAARVRVPTKNYNNELGLPLTVFDRPAPGRSIALWLKLIFSAQFAAWGWRPTGIRTFVLEMGADKPGDLAYLTRIAPPSVSVVTAISSSEMTLTPVHRANYPSLQALIDEKSTLVRAVQSGGTVVLNADDPQVFSMRHLTREHVVTFGESDGADVRILSVSPVMAEGPYGKVPQGISISLECLNRPYTVMIPDVFSHTVGSSVAAALAVAVALDMDLTAVQRIHSLFKSLPGRARILPGSNHTVLFDGTYNASPPAVVSSIRDIAALPLLSTQRRAVCVGEMRELGDEAQAMHWRIGEEAAKSHIDFLVACGTMARFVADGARAHGMSDDHIHVCVDTPDAIPVLRDWMQPGDVIFCKASEGPSPSNPHWRTVTGVRMERIIKALMAEPQRAAELLPRQEARWLSIE